MAGSFGETPMGLKSQILNIAAVLERKFGLRVPRYQRPYTWGDREVRQLIQDLSRAYERKATFYFIGQIVLVKSSQGRLEISDGQQRLATLTMMFAHARDRLPGRAKTFQTLIMDGDQSRLLLRKDDQNFYRSYVQQPGFMAELARHPETSNESADLMCVAAQTIDEELRKYNDRDLDSFMSYVARCCTLNVVDADERGSAQTVFASLNIRGSPLSGADIIKSDLIENSGLSEKEADDAARRWEQTEDMFRREDFATLLGMMPFLLTGERLLSPGDLGAFRASVDRAGGVRSFLFDQLPRYAQALRSIFGNCVDVGPASTDVNRRLRLMKQVERWDWAPAAIRFLAEHGDEHERAARFFRALDCFTFGCELSVIDSRAQDRRWSRTVLNVGDDAALFGPKGALAFNEDEHERFIGTLNRSRKRDRQRRLLMLRLEAAMPGGHCLTITDDVTVEHVLPKAGGVWWNERFPDPVRRVDAANLLGNLILVTHDQNEAADTKPYPEKRKIFFNTAGAPIYALTKDIAPIDDWSLAAIEARQERLVRILCADWGLLPGDEELTFR